MAVAEQTAFHYCAPCQVEQSAASNVCWNCDKAMQSIPFWEDGRERKESTTAWSISAVKFKAIDLDTTDGVTL